MNVCVQTWRAKSKYLSLFSSVTTLLTYTAKYTYLITSHLCIDATSKATACTQEPRQIYEDTRRCAMVEWHTLLTKGVVKVFVTRLCCQLQGVTFDALKHKHTRNRKRPSSKWPPKVKRPPYNVPASLHL